MRFRLIASFILIVLVTVGIVTVVAFRQTAQEVRTFMFRGGLTGTDRYVTALENYYVENNGWQGVEIWIRKTNLPSRFLPNMGQGMMRGQNNPAQLPHMQLADLDGTILFDTRNTDRRDQLSPDELENGIPLSDRRGNPIGYLLPAGNPVITVAAETALLQRLNRSALIAVVLAGGIAILLALLLAYSLLKPVRELTQAAANMASGDLSQRVNVHGDDELATLGKTFNHMAASLQQAESSRRALTADIAHELRTPLSVQRAHLEALDDGIYELSPETLKPIEEQNRLLTRLVDDLRTLALADSGQLELVRTPTDYPALVRRVVASLEPKVADRQIQIQQSLDESCPALNLDPQRIEQVLHNLLENAFRYTPDHGLVEVRLSVMGYQCLLTLRDNGTGISPKDLPHIFDRFYRADKSRSRYDGGTGLGLSIARKIAQAHGGDLSAENHPEGGAVFTFVLPIETVSGE